MCLCILHKFDLLINGNIFHDEKRFSDKFCKQNRAVLAGKEEGDEVIGR